MTGPWAQDGTNLTVVHTPSSLLSLHDSLFPRRKVEHGQRGFPGSQKDTGGERRRRKHRGFTWGFDRFEQELTTVLTSPPWPELQHLPSLSLSSSLTLGPGPPNPTFHAKPGITRNNKKLILFLTTFNTFMLKQGPGTGASTPFCADGINNIKRGEGRALCADGRAQPKVKPG